jgi:peptide deformylase
MERAARVYGGMGIAAVQVGVPVRLALLRRDNGRGEFQAFLNPELLWASGELSDSWENCLSVPWGYRHTSRPREIRVRYQTVSGLTRIETLMHDEAVVFQQELDHMDGALLSEGHDRRWFIPKDEIAGFVTEMGKLCREIPEAECRKLIQARIAARAGAAPP